MTIIIIVIVVIVVIIDIIVHSLSAHLSHCPRRTTAGINNEQTRISQDFAEQKHKEIVMNTQTTEMWSTIKRTILKNTKISRCM